jgi:hypothetical protein
MKKTTFATMTEKQLDNYAFILSSAYIAECHAEMITELEVRLLNSLTNKERNHFKRLASATEKFKSVFCSSLKATCQAARIDDAFTEFHTMTELLALETLDDCKESRVKSHRSFLKNEFKHVCKEVIHADDTNKLEHHKRFKFELI